MAFENFYNSVQKHLKAMNGQANNQMKTSFKKPVNTIKKTADNVVKGCCGKNKKS
ncbi:hypothetical protein GA0061094_0125 [[Bacillus] enclensis]|uniref:Uncharacterized protein n=1 Tax=[Bacillus] enclensis TaxID=1402860 RepID=A0A1C3YSU4_9BACI|nr:hypothetical protein [[Bacillus] enclensis]QTC41797.1 hypothetical protein I7V34_00485 [Bacillus sp. V3]SCB73149.1 hypothetical protein GA0061094_0125 [[Bacillus] enclensis]